ncbi:MAG: septum formation protein Maf [Verrucomicrobia bacterium]|nr:septum formation protein Maf [Verrucomicrobiota bacterium]
MESKQPAPEKLILASASPRRRELLGRLGLEFEVQVAPVVESECTERGPEWMVAHNAALKADAVAATVGNCLVLGSDTTVAVDGVVLGKPRDRAEARRMLELLSGRVHVVYTAVALRWVSGDYCCDFVEASEVRFKDLEAAVIERYHRLVDPMDKAGAYGIQEGREMIIDSVKGSVENVMGLPIQRLGDILREQGFDFKLSMLE